MGFVILDEQEIGVAKKGDSLFFPNIQSCTAIVAVLNSGELIGAHYVMDKPLSFTHKLFETFSPKTILSANMLYIMQKMKESLLNNLHVDKIKKGKISRFFMLSSSWGYNVNLAEQTAHMIFKPDRLTRIDVDCPAMDVLLETNDKTLTIFERSDGKILKLYSNYLNISGGLLFVDMIPN